MKILALIPVVLVAAALAPTVATTTGCTKQQAQQADTVAVDLTNAVCTSLEGQPAGQPLVDIVCTVAQGVESGIATLSTGDAGVSAPALRTVRLRLPAAEAPAFLAAHAAKKS